jgi:hypothetical protein
VNRFFSVPAHQVRVNDAQVNAFVYASARDAGTEASSISVDGQPSPTTRVTWVSTPHFYRREALIVLYVGCSAEIVQALQATVGAPLVVGPTPCARNDSWSDSRTDWSQDRGGFTGDRSRY